MPEDRIRVAPNTVAYADRESHKLVVEFAIPGAPTETIDVKILEDSVHLTAPARDIEFVSALALGYVRSPSIVLVLVSAPPALMAIFTAPSIGRTRPYGRVSGSGLSSSVHTEGGWPAATARHRRIGG